MTCSLNQQRERERANKVERKSRDRIQTERKGCITANGFMQSHTHTLTHTHTHTHTHTQSRVGV